MEKEKGYYYLHSNGELIYKRYLDYMQVEDFRESPFVTMFWDFENTDRACAWEILVSALCLGAKESRIIELADKWKCTNEDAIQFAKYYNFILEKDGNMFCAKRNDFSNLQESPAGFGITALIAISDLLKQQGYKSDKYCSLNLMSYYLETKE
jgi:hypothetical protein